MHDRNELGGLYRGKGGSASGGRRDDPCAARPLALSSLLAFLLYKVVALKRKAFATEGMHGAA